MAMLSMNEKDPLYQDINEIAKTADRAGNLTRQLLAFSRKQARSPKVVNLSSIIRNIEKMLNRIIGENIELCTENLFDAGLIEADPSQIEQVIVNLIVNARDAMPEGGKVIIRTECRDLDSNHLIYNPETITGEYIVLTIEDNGTGMSDEVKAHIFEPFFTTKAKGKGTGLGLSTVFGIVMQNNGYIDLDSKLGEGTRIKIYLPKTEKSYKAVEEKITQNKELMGNETVLVVEDEELLRNTLRRTLEKFGYSIMEADSGEKALELCKANGDKVELIISDIMMEGINGLEFVKRARGFLNDVPVILMSGYAEDVIENYGFTESQYPFIQKPFKPIKLLKVMRKILNSDE